MSYPPVQLLIGGAQKAGTTAFLNYCKLSSNITFHRQNEFRYFVHEPQYRQGYNAVFADYFGKNARPPIGAKNVGILTDVEALQRIKDHNPAMKLVFLLRDPVKRAYSAYWYNLRTSRDDSPTFEDALAADGENNQSMEALRHRNYHNKGQYIEHLTRYIDQFGQEQVRVFLFESFTADPIGITNELMAWLDCPPIEVEDQDIYLNSAAMPRSKSLAKMTSSATRQSRLKSLLKSVLPYQVKSQFRRFIVNLNEVPFEKPPMNPETRNRLALHYEPYNKQLAEYLQCDLSGWTWPEK